MGWLKKIAVTLDQRGEATDEFIKDNPYISVFGLPLSAAVDKAIAKAINKSAEDYVFEGKKQGYAEASDVYEKKLLKQADKFTKEKDAFKKERDEYEALLDKFDKRICELQEKVDKSQQEIELLNELLLKERELRKLGE